MDYETDLKTILESLKTELKVNYKLEEDVARIAHATNNDQLYNTLIELSAVGKFLKHEVIRVSAIIEEGDICEHKADC